jgi:hypothetical protein
VVLGGVRGGALLVGVDEVLLAEVLLGVFVGLL